MSAQELFEAMPRVMYLRAARRRRLLQIGACGFALGLVIGWLI
jgi:hypothetical protein